MKYTLELRAAEGGNDSKLLVQDMANAYTKLGERNGWTVD